MLEIYRDITTSSRINWGSCVQIFLACAVYPLFKIGQGRDTRFLGSSGFVPTTQPTAVDETLDHSPATPLAGAPHPQGSVQPQGSADRVMPRIISATKKAKYNVILEELNRGVEVDTTDSEGATPLYWSACRGDITLTRFLMEKGANVNHRVRWESTPLHAAADRGHEQCVECLLNGNADVNAQNRNQDTPLHLAAYRGYYQVCLLLLAYNASMHLHNFKGKTPYQEAKEAGHSRIIKILDPNSKRGTFPLENKSLGDIYRNKFTTENQEIRGEYDRQLSEPSPSSLQRSTNSSFGEPILLNGAENPSSRRSFPNLSMLSSFPTNVNGTSPYTQRSNLPQSRVYYERLSSAQPPQPHISAKLLHQLNQCPPLPAQRPIYIQADDRDVYTRIENLELQLACAESTKSALEQENALLRNENSMLRQEISSYRRGLHQNGHEGRARESIESITATINELKDCLEREKLLRLEAESRARQAMKDMFTFRTRFDDLVRSANCGSDHSTSAESSRSDSSFLNNFDKKGS